MRLRPLLAFLPLAAAWSCDAVPASSGSLDLSALGGVKEATKETETPPTKNTARVRFDICGKLPKEDGAKDEDQVGVADRRGPAQRQSEQRPSGEKERRAEKAESLHTQLCWPCGAEHGVSEEAEEGIGWRRKVANHHAEKCFGPLMCSSERR